MDSSKTLVIAVGDYGTGKTSFAKWYAKEYGGVYLDFELLYCGDGNDGSFGIFLNRLKATMEKSRSKLFVMDGLSDVTTKPERELVPLSAHLRDNIVCEVQVCLCFAAPHVVHARQIAKACHTSYPLPDSEEVIKLKIYQRYNMVAGSEENPLFVDTTDGFHILTKEEFPQRWEELIFYSDLTKMLHDKYYGDIVLPSGIKISGYTQSHKSWERLVHLVDFKDKDVLDLGCFHGYFCFKAEEAGACAVTGVEADENTLEVAKKVAMLRKSKVRLCRGDLDDFEAGCVYDIVLALNVLQHIKNIDHALNNIFRSSKTAVFEVPVSQKGIISKYAEQFGFDLVGRANSHREGREIIVFADAKGGIITFPVIPTEYRYNYRRARLKKLPREVAVKIIWRLEAYFPFKWLMRKYRDIREARARRLIYR